MEDEVARGASDGFVRTDVLLRTTRSTYLDRVRSFWGLERFLKSYPAPSHELARPRVHEPNFSKIAEIDAGESSRITRATTLSTTRERAISWDQPAACVRAPAGYCGKETALVERFRAWAKAAQDAEPIKATVISRTRSNAEEAAGFFFFFFVKFEFPRSTALRRHGGGDPRI